MRRRIVNVRAVPRARKVRELTRFMPDEYDARDMKQRATDRVPSSGPPRDDGPEIVDVPRALDDDWDDVFAWSYGQRFWNLGCG